VIDLDTSLDGGPDGLDNLCEVARKEGEKIPLTRLHRTRSGGAQLIYQAVPGREIPNSSGKIAPLVDVRGTGGYIVAPGSYVAADKKPGGWYVIADDRPPLPLPGWLADLAHPRMPQHQARCTASAGGRATGDVRRRLEGLLAVVYDAREGSRNSSLYWAACRTAEMTAEGLVGREDAIDLLTGAGVETGLDEVEVHRTLASAFRGTDDTT
jgi:hypothetical protein